MVEASCAGVDVVLDELEPSPVFEMNKAAEDIEVTNRKWRTLDPSPADESSESISKSGSSTVLATSQTSKNQCHDGKPSNKTTS
jgi:hypothetical protein